MGTQEFIIKTVLSNAYIPMWPKVRYVRLNLNQW